MTAFAERRLQAMKHLRLAARRLSEAGDMDLAREARATLNRLTDRMLPRKPPAKPAEEDF